MLHDVYRTANATCSSTELLRPAIDVPPATPTDAAPVGLSINFASLLSMAATLTPGDAIGDAAITPPDLLITPTIASMQGSQQI
jgi:hypothetical protein